MTYRHETNATPYDGVQPTTLVDDPTDRATSAMMAHILGRATDDQLLFLEEDLDDWRARLVDHKNRVDALIVTMGTEWQQQKNRHLAKGPRWKDAWFNWFHQWQEHRAIVVAHGTKVQGALAHVNTLRSAEHADRNEATWSKLRATLDRIDKLERRVFALEQAIAAGEKDPGPRVGR